LLEGGWDVNWTNPGGQIPDISYLVIYEVCPPIPEPTPTEPPFQFEWSVYANCEHIEIRVHNKNNFVVHVEGEINAQKTLNRLKR
jgi:hypothetical protein